jgi:hypothetical protein
MYNVDETNESRENAFKRQLRERRLQPSEDEVKQVAEELIQEIVAWFKKNGAKDVEVKHLEPFFNQMNYVKVSGTIRGSQLAFKFHVGKTMGGRSPAYTRVEQSIGGDITDRHRLTQHIRSNPALLFYWGNKIDIGGMLNDTENVILVLPKSCSATKTASREMIANYTDNTGEDETTAFKRQLRERSLVPDKGEVEARLKKFAKRVREWFESLGFDKDKILEHRGSGFSDSISHVVYTTGYDHRVVMIVRPSVDIEPAETRFGGRVGNMAIAEKVAYWPNEPDLEEVLKKTEAQIKFWNMLPMRVNKIGTALFLGTSTRRVWLTPVQQSEEKEFGEFWKKWVLGGHAVFEAENQLEDVPLKKTWVIFADTESLAANLLRLEIGGSPEAIATIKLVKKAKTGR